MPTVTAAIAGPTIGIRAVAPASAKEAVAVAPSSAPVWDTAWFVCAEAAPRPWNDETPGHRIFCDGVHQAHLFSGAFGRYTLWRSLAAIESLPV
jgi:hypothetical protein